MKRILVKTGIAVFAALLAIVPSAGAQAQHAPGQKPRPKAHTAQASLAATNKLLLAQDNAISGSTKPVKKKAHAK